MINILIIYFFAADNYLVIIMKERPRLDKIVNVALAITGVTRKQLIGHGRSSQINICRGIYLMLAYEYGYKTEEAAKEIHRSRTSCITTTNRYLGYYSVGDKTITKYFIESLNLLRNGK